MQYHTHPLSDYKPDFGNSYISSSRVRFWLGAWEFFRFLISSLVAIAILGAFVAAGVIMHWENWMFIIVTLFFTGSIFGIASRFGLFRKVPIRCSQCRRLLEREVIDTSAQRAVVFYVCPSCHVYLDSRLTE